MIMFRRLGPAAIALGVVISFACSKGKDRGTKTPTILAKVGDRTISVDLFKARLAEQPSFSLSRYKSMDRRKEFLENMVRSEVLVQEAQRRGLDRDPEVLAGIEKVLVHKLTRVYSEERGPVQDADLRRYYDQHRSEFVMPTRVRVAHLFLAALENDSRRSRALAEVTRLLKEANARAARGEKQPLELLASQRSEDAATKATGGDLGFRTREEVISAWGQSFADAVFAPRAQNEHGPVVSTPKGFHLFKVLGRHEGYDTSFDAAKSRIEGRLITERRERLMDDLASELRMKTKVEIDEKALAAIEVGPSERPTTVSTAEKTRPVIAPPAER
jgi:peptidyl-prolyl cis-trans isomerase C